MPDTSISVSATVEAPAARVFDLLASPHRHHEIDASGMVGSDEFDEPIIKVGQVFRMNMTRNSKVGRTEYQTDNLVCAFKANAEIAWQVAEVDGKPLGWSWRYDLTPKGKRDQKTVVTLTYDWTDTLPTNLERFGVPVFAAADLEDSLRLLAKAVGR